MKIFNHSCPTGKWPMKSACPTGKSPSTDYRTWFVLSPVTVVVWDMGKSCCPYSHHCSHPFEQSPWSCSYPKTPATSLLCPVFYVPIVVAVMWFHCSWKQYGPIMKKMSHLTLTPSAVFMAPASGPYVWVRIRPTLWEERGTQIYTVEVLVWQLEKILNNVHHLSLWC